MMKMVNEREVRIGMLLGIGVIVLAVINLYLYHKMFHVVYFGLGKGILKEVVGSLFAAVLEIALLMAIGPVVISFILGVLGWLLGAALIGGGIAAVIYAVWRIGKAVKAKNGQGINTDNDGVGQDDV